MNNTIPSKLWWAELKPMIGSFLQTVAGGDPTKVIEMLDKIVPKGDSSSQSSIISSQVNAKLVVFAAAAALLGKAPLHGIASLQMSVVAE